jgi:hypothetical protein
MSHSELAIAGFYDHEQQYQEQRAPDWGGDDVFAAPVPRRRFSASSASPATGTGELSQAAVEELEREDEPTLEEELRLAADAYAAKLAAAPVKDAPDERYLEPVGPGRRTVTITGRPEGTAMVRRPARTLDERFAARPERVASWACALGFLLIVLAVLTAH